MEFVKWIHNALRVCVWGGVAVSSLKHIALHAPESHCCCSLWASARSSTMVPSCSSHCLCISILLDSDASNSSLLCDRASLRCPSSLSPAVCIQHSYSPLFTIFRRHSGWRLCTYVAAVVLTGRPGWALVCVWVPVRVCLSLRSTTPPRPGDS